MASNAVMAFCALKSSKSRIEFLNTFSVSGKKNLRSCCTIYKNSFKQSEIKMIF